VVSHGRSTGAPVCDAHKDGHGNGYVDFGSVEDKGGPSGSACEVLAGAGQVDRRRSCCIHYGHKSVNPTLYYWSLTVLRPARDRVDAQ
jgi:hypothetical protein